MNILNNQRGHSDWSGLALLLLIIVIVFCLIDVGFIVLSLFSFLKWKIMWLGFLCAVFAVAWSVYLYILYRG